jgi:hypothetical protein
MRWGLCVLLASATAVAKPLELTTFTAGTFTVSVPKGWTTKLNGDDEHVVAQQDPKRKDAAKLFVTVLSADPGANLDSILDQLVSGLGDHKVVKKGGFGANGRQVVVDAMAEHTKARLVAVATSSADNFVVVTFAARLDQFDELGGVDLVTSVVGSIKPVVAHLLVKPDGPAMTPNYSNHHLLIPPATRQLTLPDLAGDWIDDSKAQSKIAITAKGEYRFADDKVAGAISIHGDTISITFSGKKSATLYLVRGWFVDVDFVSLKLLGPYDDKVPDAARKADPAKAPSVIWMRERR